MEGEANSKTPTQENDVEKQTSVFVSSSVCLTDCVSAPGVTIATGATPDTTSNTTLYSTPDTTPDTASQNPDETKKDFPDVMLNNQQNAKQIFFDTILAIQLQRIENNRLDKTNISVLVGKAEKDETSSQKTKCTRGHIILCLIFTPPILLALFSGFVIGMAKYGTSRSWSGSFSDLPELFIPDNFTNDEPYVWKINNQEFGLQMEIVSALSEDWHSFFDTAVQDWDDGNPDALNLKTTKSKPDSDCTPLAGKIKVCNGNYGHTDWKGINELIYKSGYVIASTAKMNDYYMESVSPAERQYLMCHEIGHGFGLPHSDEDFHNKDLGDCMDYTNRPENSQSPSTTNYELLYQMYGQIDHNSRRIRKDDSASDSFDDFDFRSRNLSFLNSDSSRWTLMNGSEHHETYESDIGNGYVIQAHISLN